MAKGWNGAGGAVEADSNVHGISVEADWNRGLDGMIQAVSAMGSSQEGA